MFHINI